MSERTLTARFWSKVEVRGFDECWPWKASIHDAGYGQIYLKEKGGGSIKEFSHRVAWALTRGPVPEGTHVLHRCDNRPCCNPCHHFAGTNDDNVADKVAKGRQEKGEQHNGAKLKEAEIQSIRDGKDSYSAAGREYGVAAATIRDVRLRRTWKHVP